MLSNPRPRVLYVENDEDSREMLSMLLNLRQLETETVATAGEALSLIQSARFDLYLFDVSLPDLDGFELCRRIRASDSRTPIIIFSGSASGADQRRGIEAGANAYVTKPNVDGLLASITYFVFNGVSATPPIPAAREVNIPRTSDLIQAKEPYNEDKSNGEQDRDDHPGGCANTWRRPQLDRSRPGARQPW